MNIDDFKLQLYVDGELDTKDISEVEKFIQDNPSAKKKVDEYRQINNLLFEKYKSIEQENIPQRTIDLLIKEKKSIFEKFFNYEIKLVNALAAACVMLIVFTVTNYNFDNKNLDNLNVKGKTSILNELSNII
jgi:anti-sigma factor RsiW